MTGPAAIVVDRPGGLIDRALRIELHGFAPGQAVDVTLTQFVINARWQARASYRADLDGHVCLAGQAPLPGGAYQGVDPMGLFWSAIPLPEPPQVASVDWVTRPWTIEVEAKGPDGAVASCAFDRHAVGPGVLRRPVDEDGLVGTLFLPAGEGPHRAVIVCAGGGGGVDEVKGAMLASHGFAAFNLAHFGRPGLPRGLVNIPLEYFERAIAWLRGQPWLGKDGFLAAWGPSRGGELALLLGATFPQINAVVAWVPSGVMFWGIGPNAPGDGGGRASWTWRGAPLPYLQENNRFVTPPPGVEAGRPIAYAPIYRSHLQDEAAVERATIPVERIAGPVLLVSGTDDQMWPSTELADIALRRLQVCGHRHRFEHVRYEGAGHTILVPYGPRTRLVSSFSVPGLEGLLYSQGGSPRVDSEAGVDAWRRTLAFLAEASHSH
jgi:dienelactone hydrolase